jgi:Co/Zn/Cd efflux system component
MFANSPLFYLFQISHTNFFLLLLLLGFLFDIMPLRKLISNNKNGVNSMGKFVAVFGGLIAMAGGILLAVFVWWREFYELVFGMIPPLLFFIGLIALIAGISSIKDSKRTKKLEEETPAEEISEKETEQEPE